MRGRSEKGWRLSPAYDVVPFPQVSLERDLAIGVDSNGRQATVKNALSEIASFGLTREDGVAVASTMQQAIKASWEGLFGKHGFTPTEIERLRTCSIACDEKIQELDESRRRP